MGSILKHQCLQFSFFSWDFWKKASSSNKFCTRHLPLPCDITIAFWEKAKRIFGLGDLHISVEVIKIYPTYTSTKMKNGPQKVNIKTKHSVSSVNIYLSSSMESSLWKHSSPTRITLWRKISTENEPEFTNFQLVKHVAADSWVGGEKLSHSKLPFNEVNFWNSFPDLVDEHEKRACSLLWLIVPFPFTNWRCKH